MPRRKKPPEPEKPPRRRRGTGSVTILKDERIRARLPAPKRTAREFPPGRMAEAVAWLDAQIHPQPVAVAAAVLTVEQWAGIWHATYVAPIRPPNTARWYLYALRHLAPLYPLALPDLRASAVQAIVGRLVGQLDAATIQSIVGVWRRCLDAAVEDELLARNPARRLTIPKPPPRIVRRHVTAAEVASLWPAIVGHRFEAAYALLLGCGLRIGEVLGLEWANVRLGERRAWIQRQYTNGHWRDLPKGRNPHWVRLPDRVIAAMIRHRNAQPEGTVLVMQTPFPFHGRGGARRLARPHEPKPYAAQTVRKDLAAICAGLELEHLRPHDARRGLVTALLDGGVSPAVVAEIAGHADQATTLRSYAGRSDEARRHAADVVDRYLGDAPGDVSGTDNVG